MHTVGPVVACELHKQQLTALLLLLPQCAEMQVPPIPSLLIGRERDSAINLNNFRIGDSMSVALRTGLEQIGAQGVRGHPRDIPSSLPAPEPTLNLAHAQSNPSRDPAICL